jgi:L-serine/L-threonine ammonia-lyase
MGAEVLVHGTMWSEAHSKALAIASEPGCELIHPFEHPDIWEGHATLIKECFTQMKAKPTSIVTVVGGGGLLSGICEGLVAVGWANVPIFGVETRGAQSYTLSVEKNELVTLPAVTSIAKTLGAASVSPTAFEWRKKVRIVPIVVSDGQAVKALIQFLNEHRLLVEVSCAAGLSLLFDESVFKQYESELGDNILVVICGGNLISLEYLDELKKTYCS